MPNLSTTQGRADFIYTYLSHHGLTKKAAAAALGNFAVEAPGYIPTTPGGYLAQWQGSRYQGLQNFAYSLHQPVTKLKVQVSYVSYELKKIFPTALHNLNAATTPIAAADVFCWQYESPNPQYADLGKRESIAQTEYDLFAGK
jgi:hypothetical protein